MPPRPRLSLCIPTYNRATFLEGAIQSGLEEAKKQAPGIVEVLVCDNASSDETPDLISRIQTAHPELRAFRNSKNLGFDLNYLRCVEEARGEFVWVMGDDDVWNPGCVSRVLGELEAGADACLCLAEACDLELKPTIVLPWYLDPNPPTVWHLESRKDLIRYFNACARNAGVFAFISVAIFRRDRFLLHRESLQEAIGSCYVHLWGMMAFLRQPALLRYIPECLVQARMSDAHSDSYASANLYGRWMLDLHAWVHIANVVFGDDPELQDAFCRIVGRNHHNTILPGLRQHAPSEAAWLEAKPYLVRAGFSPVRIAAVDLAFQHMYGDRLPMPTLHPESLCLVDLPLLARGARRIAVLALTGLQSLMEGAALLAALRNAGRTHHVRVFCTPDCAALLAGFEQQCLDPRRYAGDVPYRETIARTISDYAPELVVNLDRNRGIQSDDMAAAASPAGGIAFELPKREQDDKAMRFLNNSYQYLLPKEAGPDALLDALGLEPTAATLWPSEAAREEASQIFKGLGWEEAQTLAVLVDHPSIPADPAFQTALRQAARSTGKALGFGGRGSHALLQDLLTPWGDRAVNLGGILGLGATAALLQRCGGFLGGTPLLQALARACGCAPIPPPVGSTGAHWKGRRRFLRIPLKKPLKNR